MERRLRVALRADRIGYLLFLLGGIVAASAMFWVDVPLAVVTLGAVLMLNGLLLLRRYR